MKKQHRIRVDEPCNESWSGMVPKDNGRFCESCNKVVIDFSGWSDGRIHDFVEANNGQELCGNFGSSQLNRDLTISGTTPDFNLKLVLVGFSLSALLGLESCKSDKEVVGKLYIQQTTAETMRGNHTTTNNSIKELKLAIRITGTVIDADKNAPSKNATITVNFKDGAISQIVESNKKGMFSFEIHDETEAESIVVRKEGMKTIHMTYAEFEASNRVVQLHKMKKSEMIRGKFIIESKR